MEVDAKPTADSNSVASTATVTAAPIVTAVPSNHHSQTATLPQFHLQPNIPPGGGSKYNQLLALIEELGKDIRPTYTGNRNCTERLKRAIGHARVLTRECINDVEKNARQSQ